MINVKGCESCAISMRLANLFSLVIDLFFQRKSSLNLILLTVMIWVSVTCFGTNGA